MTEKVKKISFRCNEGLYSFLYETSRKNKLVISDLIRIMLQSYYIMWIFGEVESYPKLKKKFLEFFDNIEKNTDTEVLEYLKSKQTIPSYIFKGELNER